MPGTESATDRSGPQERATGDLSGLAEAVVGESVIFQRYSFSLGAALHPEELAQRLLAEGVAVVAVDGLGEVMVPASIADAMRQLEDLDAAREELNGARLSSLAKFAVRHPRLAMRILRGVLRRQPGETGHSNSGTESDSIRAMAGELLYQYGELASLEGLASVVDLELLRPKFLTSEPWVRLSLPPFAVSFEAGLEEDVIDVSLLVHRSGEAVLMFAFVVSAELASVDLLNSRAGCTTPNLVRSRLDGQILDLYGAALGVELDEGEEVRGEGRRQVQFVHAEGMVSLGGIFDVYREAIVFAATGEQLPEHLYEFLMTPQISVRGLRDSDHDVVGNALATHSNAESLTTSRVRISDRLVTGPFPLWSADVYLSAACVVSLATDRFRQGTIDSIEQDEPVEPDWAYPEVALGLAVDIALLRLRMVEVFGGRLAAARSSHDLNVAASGLLASYSEVSGDRLLKAGDLIEVEEAFLSCHDFAERRDAVLAQHQMSLELAGGLESERARRSSARTQGFIVLLTVLVAVLGSIGSLLQPGVGADWMPTLGSWSFEEWGPAVMVGLPAMLLLGLALWVFVTIGGRFGRRLKRPTRLARLPSPPATRADRLPGGGFRFVGSERPLD